MPAYGPYLFLDWATRRAKDMAHRLGFGPYPDWDVALRKFSTGITSWPEVREPKAPDFVRPEAYIAWGDPSDFQGDFRKRAQNIIFVPPKWLPLDGVYTEEARTWEDFYVSNPEDESQKIICRRTTAIAFRSDRSTPNKEGKNTGIPDQMIMTFQNSGSEGWPFHRNSTGKNFEPIVLSPFEQIAEVNWGGLYLIISAMSKDIEASLEMKLTLVEPPVGEDDSIQNGCTGGYQKESDGTHGDSTRHHHSYYVPDPFAKPPHPWAIAFGVDASVGMAGVVYHDFAIAIFDQYDVSSPLDEFRKKVPDNPGGKTDPWQWIPDQWGHNFVYDNYSTLPGGQHVILGTGSQSIHFSAGIFGTENYTAYFWIKQFLAWEERYYKPYGFSAWAVDLDKLMQKYGKDYQVNQGQPMVGVHFNIPKIEDADEISPELKVRWAIYRGKMDLDDPESAYVTISRGPYDNSIDYGDGGDGEGGGPALFAGPGDPGSPKENTGGPFDMRYVSADTIWQWLLIPNPPNAQAALKLIDWGETRLDPLSVEPFERTEIVWAWDILQGGKPGWG